MVIYTDHTATRYFMLKNNAKPQLIRWLLLLQEFNVEIRDKKGTKNVVTDHLSRLKLKNKLMIPMILMSLSLMTSCLELILMHLGTQTL